MTEYSWVICVFLNNLEQTRKAVDTALAQTGVGKVRVLLVGCGLGEEDKRAALAWRADGEVKDTLSRLLLWSWDPPLPSLAACWNRALNFVWNMGGERALVINNDIEMHPETYARLEEVREHEDALFVSAVAVTREQFEAQRAAPNLLQLSRGGPDFSCFLITKKAHDLYRFDENFIPAYCEDLDYHRTLMLLGEGRRIFSCDVPYFHHASGTLKAMDEEKRRKTHEAIMRGARAYYQRKWGGDVNQEKFVWPFNQVELSSKEQLADLPPETPELHKLVREGKI